VWCDSEYPEFRLRKESLLLVYRIPHFIPLPVLEERVAEELAEDVAEERQCNQKAHIFLLSFVGYSDCKVIGTCPQSRFVRYSCVTIWHFCFVFLPMKKQHLSVSKFFRIFAKN
jgi:hypothetical protein